MSQTLGAAWHVKLEPARQADVLALIDELDAYQKPLYPAESHHGIDIDALSQANVLFVVARGERGEAVGCGAVMLEHDHGEVKRMFVSPALRGQGVAQALLDTLQAHCLEHGCKTLKLETGIRQPEAIRFYERSGFARCGPFGSYQHDPLSVFMVKQLP